MRKIGIFLIVAVLFFASGCETLRKKFVRKKDAKKEKQVYVNFKDYPTTPSREAYIDYYVFVCGWIDELTKAIETGGMRKKEKQSINEALMNLEQIISFLNEPGQKAVLPLHKQLLSIKQDVEANASLNEIKKDTMLRKVEHFKRKFQAEFNYTDAEKWLEMD